MVDEVNCIFCKIVNKEIPAPVIYEDEKTIAFLDIRPASPKGGHTLVIPKKHFVNIIDLPEEELQAIMKTVKKVSVALSKLYPGMNILGNNGVVAGQFIMHAHFHIIPRSEGDGITVEKWNVAQYQEGQMQQVLEKIKSLL